jgi:hypothetical protein
MTYFKCSFYHSCLKYTIKGLFFIESKTMRASKNQPPWSATSSVEGKNKKEEDNKPARDLPRKVLGVKSLQGP